MTCSWWIAGLLCVVCTAQAASGLACPCCSQDRAVRLQLRLQVNEGGSPMSNLACILWWLIPGIFLGWVSWWLFDKLFRRNGETIVESSKRDIATAQSRATGLETELANSRKLTTTHAADITRLKTELAAAQAAQGNEHNTLGLVQTELGTTKQQAEKAGVELAKLQGDLVAWQNHAAGQDKTLAALRAELDGLKTSNGSATGELQKYKTAYEAGQASIAQLQQQLTASQNDAAGKMTALQQQLSAGQGDYASQIAKLTADLTTARSAHETSQQSLGLLQNELVGTKSSATGASAELTKLKADLDAARDAVNAARMGQADTAAEISRLKTALAQSEANSRSAAQLQLELDAAKKSLAAGAEKDAELNRLQAELAAAAKRTTDDQATLKLLQGDINAARAREGEVQGAIKGMQTDLASYKSRFEESQNMISMLHAEIEGNKRTQAALSGRINEAERAAQIESERRTNMARHGFVARTLDRDDLTLVEGIDPRIEQQLRTFGIDTHARLAVTPVEELRKILDHDGTFKLANPGTWPQQAALVVRNDWAELRRWQDTLIAGVEPPKA
jgi:chromosome segregation ATPase